LRTSTSGPWRCLVGCDHDDGDLSHEAPVPP
jgi:hypothetical protein